MTIEVVKYNPEYERGWLHCRVLSFLETQYFDNVYKEKEIYKNKSIELVALENDQVIGLIDIEIEKSPASICSDDRLLSAMLWHVAVHPDHQRKGVGERLLNEATSQLQLKGIRRIEAWTKEDAFVRDWYFKNNFQKFNSYYHVRLKGESVALRSPTKGLRVCSAFSHYTGRDVELVREVADKIEECVGLEKSLD